MQRYACSYSPSSLNCLEAEIEQGACVWARVLRRCVSASPSSCRQMPNGCQQHSFGVVLFSICLFKVNKLRSSTHKLSILLRPPDSCARGPYVAVCTTCNWYIYAHIYSVRPYVCKHSAFSHRFEYVCVCVDAHASYESSTKPAAYKKTK